MNYAETKKTTWLTIHMDSPSTSQSWEAREWSKPRGAVEISDHQTWLSHYWPYRYQPWEAGNSYQYLSTMTAARKIVTFIGVFCCWVCPLWWSSAQRLDCTSVWMVKWCISILPSVQLLCCKAVSPAHVLMPTSLPSSLCRVVMSGHHKSDLVTYKWQHGLLLIHLFS